MDNRQQIEDWNGVLGQTWAERQDEIERIVERLGTLALDAADARPGERVLDVGCGGGTTTFALARQVGPTGRVLGVDVSQPLLAVARRRVAADPLPQLSFVEGDAAHAALPDGLDLLFSRFGVMFFADPVAALAHLRASLRPGGRVLFLCWRTPRDNPWAMTPLLAARAALGVEPPETDPDAPGPFAFADEARVRRILQDAGYAEATLTRTDVPLVLGVSLGEAARASVRVGPTSRLLREAGAAHEPRVLAAIESALAPHAGSDGAVRLSASAWMVRARNPA